VTYWAMNAVFLAVVAVVGVLALVTRRAGRTTRRRAPARALLAALVLLLALTAVFDNLMIGVGLVGYDASRISGAFVGIAPLEDFAYTVAAVVLLPSLWALLGRRRRESTGRATPVGTPAAASARPSGSRTAGGAAPGGSAKGGSDG
jgi:lycopene cyclase domain-containing protein